MSGLTASQHDVIVSEQLIELLALSAVKHLLAVIQKISKGFKWFPTEVT